MIENRRLLVAAAFGGLIVAGCERKPDERSDERAKAAGEVLEGTISDAMIATDRVRAEAPVAPQPVEASDGKRGKAEAKAVEGGTPDGSPTPEATPATAAGPASQPAAAGPAA